MANIVNISKSTKINTPSEFLGALKKLPTTDLEAFIFPELCKLLARQSELKAKQHLNANEISELRSVSKSIKSKKVNRENTIASVCKNLFVIAKRFNTRVYYNQLDGKFYFFAKTHFVPIPPEIINFLFIASAENLGINASDAAYHKFLSDCAKTYACSFPFPAPIFNSEIVLINCQNCTLAINAATGAVTERVHNPEDALTYVLPYAYNKLADCPKFESLLSDIFDSEQSVLHFIQHCGYLLIPHCSNILPAEKAAILYGGGGNGKSTLRKIITATFGASNVSGLSLNDLEDANTRSLMLGKIVNFPEEMGNCRDFDLLKRLVSGESITYKVLFKDRRETNNYPKLMLCTNHLPSGDKTDAFERRFDIFFLQKKFLGPNRKIGIAEEIIATELPGILNLLIRALQSVLKRRGFVESESVKAEAKEYRNLTDSVNAFLDRFEIEPGVNVYALSSLRQAYELFCFDELGAKPVAALTFSQRLKAAGFFIEIGRGRFRKIALKHNRELNIKSLNAF